MDCFLVFFATSRIDPFIPKMIKINYPPTNQGALTQVKCHRSGAADKALADTLTSHGVPWACLRSREG